MKKINNFILHQNSKLDVIGLGTYNLRNYQCEKAVIKALEIGYRHKDTANIYNNEKNIGNSIKNSNLKRKELFLTSKISIKTKYQEIKNQLQQSLIDLKTVYLDLYLIHWPIFETNLIDMLIILEELKDENLIKHYGVSNFNIKSLEICIKNKFNIFCNQIEFHPFINQKKLLSKMNELNILPVAYRPFLKGKMQIIEKLTNISNKYKKTIFQIVLNWIKQKKIISIPMSTNHNHLSENFNSYNFNLSQEEIDIINKLSYSNIRDVNNISDFDWDV